MALLPSPSARRSGGPRRTLGALLAAAVVGSLAVVVTTPAGATAPLASVTLPGSVKALDVVTGLDAIWIARGVEIIRFVPGSTPQTFTLTGGLNARHLTVAPDGTVWFGGMNGSLGTITASGTVTARATTNAADWVNSLAVGNDGALWITASTPGTWGHIERGAPGSAMAVVPTPGGTSYDTVVRGGSGAVLQTGSNPGSVASDGTLTAVAGLPSSGVADAASIGTDAWIAASGQLTKVDAANQVTTYSGVPGGSPASITNGPGGHPWYLAAPSGQGPLNLGRIGATGPDASTQLTDPAAPAAAVDAEHLVADPTDARLWAVSWTGAIVLRPVDLAKAPSTVTVDDPGTGLAYGVAATLTAHVTPFDSGSTPTGTVAFRTFDGTLLGSTALQADGTATATVDPPADSLHLIAVYSGDATHRGELGGPATFRPVADAATVTVLTPPATLRPGANTFKVRVTSATITAQPTGVIKISALTDIPVSGGTDTTFTATLSAGTSAFTATFAPDPGFAASSDQLLPTRTSWDTDEQNYVAAAYARLFSRSVDPSGRVYWANKLRNGLSRDRFALTQVATAEYRRTVAKRVGLLPLGATVAQAQPTVDAMARKTVRELLIDSWADAKKVTSCVDGIAPEFAPKGSFMCWVKIIYTTYNGTATQDDWAAAGKIGNTLEGRRQIARALVYNDRTVRGLVESAYRSYLNRSPDPSGWTYWTKKIQAGMREEGVEARVLGSDEFFRRTLVPPA